MSDRLTEDVTKFQGRFAALKAEVGKVLVGQDEMLHRLLLGLLAGGHVLLEGVPGLAKTLVIRTLASALDGTFSRIQFTPDMLPGDVVGTQIYNPREGNYSIKRGPVFGNFILADEINRAPAKVQSALLEAMQERQVTLGDQTLSLGEPFLVLATQNPIEQEGTYPLPEAQLDRFLFNILLDYLTADQELQVIDLTTTTHVAKADPITTAEEILDFQQLVRMTPIAETVSKYAIELVRATRMKDPGAPDVIKKYVNYGGSVRAAQYLVLAAKARALMRGRYHVSFEDIRSLFIPILRHRILLNFHAESDRLTQDDILTQVLELKPAPRE